MRGDFRWGSLRHNFSTMATWSRPNVNNEISGANGVLVMFNHNHGVSNISEFAQCFDQSIIVALVQANGWLIQHVTDTNQSAANLSRQANALRFATGKCSTGAIQSQIVQTNAVQKSKS